MQKPKSTRTCLWASIILLLIGTAIGDPTAGFAIIVLSGLCAVGTIALGGKWLKLIGVLILIIALFLGQAYWSAGKSHQNKYLERARKAAAETGNTLK